MSEVTAASVRLNFQDARRLMRRADLVMQEGSKSTASERLSLARDLEECISTFAQWVDDQPDAHTAFEPITSTPSGKASHE